MASKFELTENLKPYYTSNVQKTILEKLRTSVRKSLGLRRVFIPVRRKRLLKIISFKSIACDQKVFKFGQKFLSQ